MFTEGPKDDISVSFIRGWNKALLVEATLQTISGSILMLQKSTIRMIRRRKRWYSSFPLFKNLNILPLRHLKIFFSRCGNLKSGMRAEYLVRAGTMRVMMFPQLRTYTYKNCFDIVFIRLQRLPDSLLQCNRTSTLFRGVRSWVFKPDIGLLFN